MKFLTKLIALYSVIFGLCVVILTYIVYLSNLRILEKHIKTELEVQAFHTMDKIDRMLFERYADIKVLAADPVITSRSHTPKQIEERLRAYQREYKIYASLSFFTLDRVRIADTSGRQVSKQRAFVEYWKDIAEGKEFVINVHKSVTLNEIVVHFVHVVKDKTGVPFGVVVSRMPVEELHDIVSAASTIAQDYERIDLVNKDGLLIYSKDNKGLLTDISADWEVVKSALASGSNTGSIRHSFMEEEEITTFAREAGHLDFAGDGWTLIMCIPTRTAFAPAVEMRNRIIAISAGLGLFFLVVIFFFSRTISRPILRLRDAAVEIAGGNFDKKVDLDSMDEVGQTAREFNNMAADIKRYITDLENTGAELKEALANVKTLSGMLPICAACKKIRDDQGYWKRLESYISEHSDATFSHGICPKCAKKLYPEYYKEEN